MKIQYIVGPIVCFLNVSRKTYLCDYLSLYSYSNKNLDSVVFSSEFSEVSYCDGFFYIKTFFGEIFTLGEKDWRKVPTESSYFSEYLGDWKGWSINVQELSYDQNRLVAKNRFSQRIIEKNGCFRKTLLSDFAVVSRDGGDLVALDENIEEIWRVAVFERRRTTGYSCDLHISPPLILLNRGVDWKTREGCITARAMSDGSEVWSCSYTKMPIYAFVHKALYYVIESEAVAILNPENGEVISKVNLELGEEIVLEPIGNHFVIASNMTKKLHLFDIDTYSLKEVMSLPEGFCFSGAEFNFSENHLFVELQSDHPAFSYSTKALLTIPMVNGFPDFEEDMRLENRLSMPMMLTEGADGERVYLFTVSCDSLDDLIRLGSIEIFEFACAYGEPVIGPHMNPDVKHKGKVKVVVDSDVLPEGCEETVKEWGKNLSYCLEKSAVFPGAGDQYRFDVQVELR